MRIGSGLRSPERLRPGGGRRGEGQEAGGGRWPRGGPTDEADEESLSPEWRRVRVESRGLERGERGSAQSNGMRLLHTAVHVPLHVPLHIPLHVPLHVPLLTPLHVPLHIPLLTPLHIPLLTPLHVPLHTLMHAQLCVLLPSP